MMGSNCLTGWFKSSYSTANGPNCVEARFSCDGIDIRDSKDPHGPILSFDQTSWNKFLQHLHR
jgi:hypothetical protein